MAVEELQQLLSKVEAISAKQNDLMRLTTQAAPERLESGELVSKLESVYAKENEVIRLSMILAAHSVLSATELMTSGDPEWKAIVARGEALGLDLLAKVAGSAKTSIRMEAEFAARPGGEAVAEAHRRLVVCAAARCVRIEEFVAFMRKVGVLAESVDSDSDSDSESAKRPAARRYRRPNARYFGPEWSN